MADIVISYKSDERGRAGFVVALLEAAGFSVWWDQKLAAGESYSSRIIDEIDQAKCLVVLWSKASATSDWVRGEAKVADEAGKLVPLKMDDVRIPPPYNMKHTINLVHWKGSPADPAWHEVIGAIRSVVDPSGRSKVDMGVYADTVVSRSGHLIHKLKAKDTTDRWAYYFVLVAPDREQAFLRAIEGKGVIDIEDFGTVIASCYGEEPSAETKAYLKAKYGFNV